MTHSIAKMTPLATLQIRTAFVIIVTQESIVKVSNVLILIIITNLYFIKVRSTIAQKSAQRLGARVHVRIYLYIFIYACMHAYIHTYIHK